MGLFFRKRRRRGGGVFGLLIIVALMVVGAPLLLNRSGSLFTSCQNAVQSLGGAGNSLCIGLQRTLGAMNEIAHYARKAVGSGGDGFDGGGEGLQASLRERWQNMTQRLDAGSNWQGQQGASSLVSMDKVRELMQGGGGGGFGGSSSDRLKQAFGSFMAGQSIGQSGEGDLDAQLAWYKNGAGMGEYGILSQLKLGSLYMGGDSGLAPDYGQAYDYNMQALGSLQQLQSSSTPEARAALGALPVEPQQLQQQLQQVLRELQLKQQ